MVFFHHIRRASQFALVVYASCVAIAFSICSDERRYNSERLIENVNLLSGRLAMINMAYIAFAYFLFHMLSLLKGHDWLQVLIPGWMFLIALAQWNIWCIALSTINLILTAISYIISWFLPNNFEGEVASHVDVENPFLDIFRADKARSKEQRTIGYLCSPMYAGGGVKGLNTIGEAGWEPFENVCGKAAYFLSRELYGEFDFSKMEGDIPFKLPEENGLAMRTINYVIDTVIGWDKLNYVRTCPQNLVRRLFINISGLPSADMIYKQNMKWASISSERTETPWASLQNKGVQDQLFDTGVACDRDSLISYFELLWSDWEEDGITTPASGQYRPPWASSIAQNAARSAYNVLFDENQAELESIASLAERVSPAFGGAPRDLVMLNPQFYTGFNPDTKKPILNDEALQLFTTIIRNYTKDAVEGAKNAFKYGELDLVQLQTFGFNVGHLQNVGDEQVGTPLSFEDFKKMSEGEQTRRRLKLSLSTLAESLDCGELSNRSRKCCSATPGPVLSNPSPYLLSYQAGKLRYNRSFK